MRIDPARRPPMWLMTSGFKVRIKPSCSFFSSILMNMEGFGFWQREGKVGGERGAWGEQKGEGESIRQCAGSVEETTGRLLLNAQKTTLWASAGLDKTLWTRTRSRAAITTAACVFVMGMTVFFHPDWWWIHSDYIGIGGAFFNPDIEGEILLQVICSSLFFFSYSPSLHRLHPAIVFPLFPSGYMG